MRQMARMEPIAASVRQSIGSECLPTKRTGALCLVWWWCMGSARDWAELLPVLGQNTTWRMCRRCSPLNLSSIQELPAFLGLSSHSGVSSLMLFQFWDIAGDLTSFLQVLFALAFVVYAYISLFGFSCVLFYNGILDVVIDSFATWKMMFD